LIQIDTPDTDLFDYPSDLFEEINQRPDFKVMCKNCKIFIDLTEIKDHKDYHDALIQMSLKYLPESEETLKDKRFFLLKNAQMKYLKKTNDFQTQKAYDWNMKVKQINNAYELLKSYINNTFETNRRLTNVNLKLDSYGKIY
jgi:hypothetical protein